MLLTDSKLDLFLILKDKFQHKLNLIVSKSKHLFITCHHYFSCRLNALTVYSRVFHLATCRGQCWHGFSWYCGSSQVVVPACQTPRGHGSVSSVQCPLLLGLRTSAASTPVAVVPDTGEVTAHTRLANIGTIGNMSPASHGLGGGSQTVKHASYYLQQLNTETVL